MLERSFPSLRSRGFEEKIGTDSCGLTVEVSPKQERTRELQICDLALTDPETVIAPQRNINDGSRKIGAVNPASGLKRATKPPGSLYFNHWAAGAIYLRYTGWSIWSWNTVC